MEAIANHNYPEIAGELIVNEIRLERATTARDLGFPKTQQYRVRAQT